MVEFITIGRHAVKDCVQLTTGSCAVSMEAKPHIILLRIRWIPPMINQIIDQFLLSLWCRSEPVILLKIICIVLGVGD